MPVVIGEGEIRLEVEGEGERWGRAGDACCADSDL
jgi:hypothetical protein